MTRLVVLSDTHVPARARRLPESVRRAAGAADLIVHAGDWVGASVLDDLLQCGPVVGVYGNNDGDDLRSRLPVVARFDVDGLRFAVVHETGAAQGREARTDAAFPDIDVLIFGHSHIPWDSTSPRGVRLLNPGSPTDRRRQPVGTFLTLRVEGGALPEVELVPVLDR